MKFSWVFQYISVNIPWKLGIPKPPWNSAFFHVLRELGWSVSTQLKRNRRIEEGREKVDEEEEEEGEDK